MPRVRRVSGQEVTIPADEVDDVRTLKRRLQPWCGVPRFRQRLLRQGCILEDDAAVTDVELQLVLLPLIHAAAEQEFELVDAADLGLAASVEAILQRPQHPDRLSERPHRLNPTALGTASDRGHTEIVALLLEACADADLYTLGVGPGYEGTALTIAASRGHVEVVRLLVEAGANQETSGGIYGDEVPPLLAAINAHSAWSADGGPTDRHMETVQLLLQAHADLNCQGRTSSRLEYDGARPLVAACQGGHVEAARLLLEHGFVDSAATPRPAASAIPHFAPALVAASSSGHVEVIRLMLEAAGLGSGEAMPTKNQKYSRDTPLSAASALGHVGIVRMLLEARAKDESTERSGATALCLAAGEGHVEIVRLLLEAERVHSG